MNNQGFIKIDRTGKAFVFGDSLQRSLSHQAGYYSLNSSSQNQISLSRVPSIPRNAELREPSIFQGDIGGIGSTIEILNFVISAKLKGSLNFVQGEVRRSLFLDAGELTAARSNHLDDRLSEILYKFGALDREVIEAAEEACVQTKQPLGNYLIKQGLLEQSQLYLYFRKQVEEIAFATLMMDRGEFYFTVSHLDENPSPLKLNAQQLLLEGVRRADEMKRYKTVLTSPQVVIEFVKTSDELDEELQALLSYIQQSFCNLQQLIDHFKVGEFNIYQRVFKLINQGYLKLADKQQFHEQKLSDSELIMLFNRTFSMIDQFAKKSGSEQALNLGLDVFRSFYQHAHLFQDISFDDKGRLDQNQILAQWEQEDQDSQDFLGQALCELLYFQIFTARNWLSNEEHQQLADVYEEISQLIAH